MSLPNSVNQQLPLPSPSNPDGVSILRTLSGWSNNLIQQLNAFGQAINQLLAQVTTNTASISTNTTNISVNSNSISTLNSEVATLQAGLPHFSNVLASNVALNNTANYFDGPTITGLGNHTYLVNGVVYVQDTGANPEFLAKLWDGENVYSSVTVGVAAADPVAIPIPFTCIVINPTGGTIKISTRDVSTTGGLMLGGQMSMINAVQIA